MRVEETGPSLFAKAFGVVAGAGTAVLVLLAVVALVVVGIPTVLCVGSCVGIAGVGAQLEIDRAEREAACLEQGLPRDCWMEQGR